MTRPLTTLKTAGITSLLLTLAACATGPTTLSATSAFEQRQSTAAVAAAESGDLALALQLWRTLVPLNSPEALQAIAALEAQIDAQAASAVDQGNAAYAENRQRAGDRWMLEALALQPENEDALAALRRSASDASHEKQAKKIAGRYALVARKEEDDRKADAEEAAAFLTQLGALYEGKDYAAVIAAASDAPASISGHVNTLVHNAHLAMAVEAYKSGDTPRQLQHLEDSLPTAGSQQAGIANQIARLRQELSDSRFKQGLALMQTNLDGAIAALEDAVRFKPENIAAREKLDQATRLRRNLQKIRSN